MSEPQQSRAQQMLGDFAPKMVSLTDDVLFGDVWERVELSPRDRSLITVAALIATGSTEQLPGHLARAQANGLTDTELKEVITHLAFYAGWPKAMSALAVAKASPQRLPSRSQAEHGHPPEHDHTARTGDGSPPDTDPPRFTRERSLVRAQPCP
jgi:4-carboxymuconolactone decarboxylase